MCVEVGLYETANQVKIKLKCLTFYHNETHTANNTQAKLKFLKLR